MRAKTRKTGCGGTESRRDPQCSRLYAWEVDWRYWNLNTHTLAECRTIIREACGLFGVEPPRVIQHKRRSLSWCIAEEALISLQATGPRGRGGKNPATALHEAAHYIAFKRHGYRIQDHGPRFLGIYIRLLDLAGVAPMVALLASAHAYKLKIA